MLKIKKCKLCGEAKSINNFYKHKGNKDGYRNECKLCRNNKYVYSCEVCGKKFSCGQKGQRFCGLKCMGVNNTGEGNSFYGKTHTSITKDKISISRKGKCVGTRHHFFGKHRDQEVIKKLIENHLGRFLGKNNPNYNHSLTDKDRITGRNFHEYRQWRQDVYARDNYTCQCCGCKKSGSFEAHHLYNYSSNENKRTDIDNGITLCKKCHKEFHTLSKYTKNTKEQFITFSNNKKNVINATN